MPHPGWELEELAPLNEFRGKVSKDTQWKVGDFGPQLEMIIDVISVSDPPDVYFPQTKAWYSVGRKDWTIVDQGIRIQGNRPEQKFHASSKYGRLLKTVAELEIEQLLDADPKDANIWWDHIFDWKREPLAFKGLQDQSGESRNVDTTVLVPAAYVGYETEGETVVAAKASDDSVLSDDIAKKLAAAMHGKSDSAGRVAVVRIPELSGNDNFMALFTNDQGYKTIMAQMQERGLLSKVGDIWQKPS